MSSFFERLFTTPAGHGAIIFGVAMFLYLGIPKAVARQQMFVRSRDYDRRNAAELAMAADPRNSQKGGPVSISQATHKKPRNK